MKEAKTKTARDTTCCETIGDPWTAKQHHWKDEAKEDHRLSPGDQAAGEIYKYTASGLGVNA